MASPVAAEAETAEAAAAEAETEAGFIRAQTVSQPAFGQHFCQRHGEHGTQACLKLGV